MPEVLQLSSGSPCTIRDVQVSPGQPHRITGARAPSAHLQLSLKPGHGCRAAGIVLRPWLLAGSQDGSTPTAAVLLVDWANSRLEVCSCQPPRQHYMIMEDDNHIKKHQV